jgi:hypothetical protein
MANAKAKATAKKATAEVKYNKFIGIMYQFKPVEGSKDRICWFDTLNAAKTETIKFPALLTDENKYLAGYVKNHTVLEVTVKELPPVENKRRFEIVSLMSENERTNLNALLSYEEAHKVNA